MVFFAPIGEYLGIMRGRDIVNPLIPIRAEMMDVEVAVVQQVDGNLPVPPLATPLLDFLSTAPDLGAVDEYLESPPSDSGYDSDSAFTVLKRLTDATLSILIDEDEDFSADQRHRLYLVPHEPLSFAVDQPSDWIEHGSSIRVFEVPHMAAVGHIEVLSVLFNLPAGGTTIGNVIDTISADHGLGAADAEALLKRDLRPLVRCHAVSIQSSASQD